MRKPSYQVQENIGSAFALFAPVCTDLPPYTDKKRTVSRWPDVNECNGFIDGYGPCNILHLDARAFPAHNRGWSGECHLTKRMACIVPLVFAMAISASAQTFTSLFGFDGTNGYAPESLIQGPNGNFYGTTVQGGASVGGTIFEITPDGQLTTLYNFCQQADCNDGESPGGLIIGPGGNFYGVTGNGGVYQSGTVFEITPAGELTTLYNFCSQPNCTDGSGPIVLVAGTDGELYGVTVYGGEDGHTNGDGTVFNITPSGQLTTIYNFCSLPNCSDGGDPSSFVLGADGNFYGTTADNHLRNTPGNVFRITPEGKLTVLHRFCSKPHCTDGSRSFGGLVRGGNGNFYGTTYYGGANETSCFQGCGTAFEITPAGQFTTLYNFCSQTGCSDGAGPESPLATDTRGNLYGTASVGGILQCFTDGCGTLFEISPGSQFTLLHSFCSQNGCSDGYYSRGQPLLATNGNLYGTTIYGGEDSSVCDEEGATGCGTIFSLSPVAKPFVQPSPGFGIIGAEVGILGNKLTGTTSVTFNGIPATFTVKSPTMIFANVPTGATSGYVTVTTANGMLKSNVPFDVLP